MKFLKNIHCIVFLSFFVFLSFIFSSAVFCCDINGTIEKLQERYDKTKDITADFKQITYTPGDMKGVFARGRVYFKRPYLMRWEYKEPEEQLIVTSGESVFLYEKDAEQVSVLPREQFLSSKISRAFFFGKGDIKRDFFVDNCTREDKLIELRLRPKKQIPQLKILFLFLDPKTYLVKRTVLEDQMGGKTQIDFSNIKVNQGMSSDLFKFSPPEGVEVFRIN